PSRLFHFAPTAEGGQTPFQHPFGFALLGGDVTHRRFLEAARGALHLDVGDEAVFVLFAESGDLIACFLNDGHQRLTRPRALWRGRTIWRKKQSPHRHRLAWNSSRS